MCCTASMWVFLHQERNTTCVSPCLSNSSTVGPGGGFRALEAGILVVMHDRIRRWRVLPLLFNHGVSSNLFNLFNGLFSPQRHHVLHPTSVSSREIHPERSILTFQIDASNRFQSRRKPMLLVEKTPSCLRRSWTTPPQPGLQRQ